MPSTIGSQMGLMGRMQTGVGIPVGPDDQPPPVQNVQYPSFSGGINVSENPEDVAPNEAIYALDMELSRAGDLIRSPGLLLTQECAPRSLQYLMQQISLDYSTELVAIDAPHMGYKGSGDMIFADASIAALGTNGAWQGLSVAGTLIFSDGVTSTYTRAPNAAVVTDISSEIVARTFATAFGRVFAGAVTPPAGTYQALGISWNAASAVLGDWSGLGSGSELIIADAVEADKIVAMAAIGYDILGVLCRHSLWAGYPTGDSTRPADFRPRVISVGAVTRGAVCTVPDGIAFLSDEGVMVYGINNVQTISAKINSAILPLDYTQLEKYQLVYMPRNQRLILRTPFDTWLYEFPRGSIKERWLHRSAIVDNYATFVDQSGDVYWDLTAGTWDSQSRTWAQMIQLQSDAASLLYATTGTKLGREDVSTTTNFGAAFTPTWRTPFAGKEQVTDLYTTLGYEIEYSSAESASIKIQLTDTLGILTGSSITKTLPATSGQVMRVRCWTNATGMNAALEITIQSGAPEIMRIRQLVRPAGPHQTSLP